MKRLIITGAIALTLVGAGAEVLVPDFAGSISAAGGGPILSYKPKPNPPCAKNMASAKSAAAAAQSQLQVDHNEARISAKQLKTLSDDMTQDAKAAEQGSDWSGLCKEIGTIESAATAE